MIKSAIISDCGASEAGRMNTYNIGPLTMEYVFRKRGLENMSDMQAVMDAVEAGLGQLSDQIGDGYQIFGNIAHKRGLEGDDIIALLDKLSEN